MASKLNPVDDNLLNFPSLLSAKDFLATSENLSPYRFSDYTYGTYPAYPGTAVFLGSYGNYCILIIIILMCSD